MDWRDSSIAFLDAHITAATVGIVNGRNGEVLGISRALTDSKYIMAKERILERFKNMSDEHYFKYTTFLKAMKLTLVLRNVSDDDLHSEDFLQGLEENVNGDVQQAINEMLQGILYKGAI